MLGCIVCLFVAAYPYVPSSAPHEKTPKSHDIKFGGGAKAPTIHPCPRSGRHKISDPESIRSPQTLPLTTPKTPIWRNAVTARRQDGARHSGRLLFPSRLFHGSPRLPRPGFPIMADPATKLLGNGPGAIETWPHPRIHTSGCRCSPRRTYGVIRSDDIPPNPAEYGYDNRAAGED